LHPSSRIFDGLKRRDFKTNNLLFYNWFFVKYFLIEQIVLDVVRCYSNNQYQAGITTQFYYNETQIELIEEILKSGSTQPVYLSLVQPRIETPLAEFASSLVRPPLEVVVMLESTPRWRLQPPSACSHLCGTLAVIIGRMCSISLGRRLNLSQGILFPGGHMVASRLIFKPPSLG
jgi:hypothetical protein